MLPDNDNTPRPASFDAAVLAYHGMLCVRSQHYVPPGKREDLVQDVILYALAHWQNFRGETYEPGSGFQSWLRWQMRAVAANQRNKKQVTTVYDDKGKYSNRIGVAADQEKTLAAMDTLARLKGRDGMALLRVGMGCSLEEVGREIGVSRERVRQITDRERARLRRVAA